MTSFFPLPMNSEKAISVESKHTIRAGITILVVDGDSTCLTIISKMLRSFEYKVMTAKRAKDAFCIIRDGEYKIDIILAECRLPDMDKYELLETVRKMSKLPIVLMFVDADGKAILGSLFKGAVLCLDKPILMNDLKSLWQFKFIKERENAVAATEISDTEEELSLENASDLNVKPRPLINEGRQSHQNQKRKISDEMEKDEEDNSDSAALKKPKLIWTKELHSRFMQAIDVLGIEGAHPKNILKHMNVPGLKKENVSSHLQKYRLYLKREQDKIQKTMNGGSTVVDAASHHLLSSFSPQEGPLQFSNPQSMAVVDQPDTNALTQERLYRCMPIPSLGSANLGNHAESNHEAPSMTKCEQQTLCTEQQDSAHPEYSLTGNEELVGFHGQVLKVETDIWDFELETLFKCPTLLDESLQEEQLQLPLPPLEPKEHDALGAERERELDEVFYRGKGTSQPFYDEDFDSFW